MSTLARGPRPRRRRASPKAGGPTIREVRLVGPGSTTPAPAWAAGEQVEWGGRAYRVAATQAVAGDGAGPDLYLFLSPATDDSAEPAA
jgi:hypothetical protein